MQTLTTPRSSRRLAGALVLSLGLQGVALAGGPEIATLTRGNWLFPDHWSGGVVPTQLGNGSTVRIDHDFVIDSAGAADTLLVGATKDRVLTIFQGSLTTLTTVVGSGADGKLEMLGGTADLGLVRLGNLTHAGRLELFHGSLQADALHVGGLLADPDRPEAVLDIRGANPSVTVTQELTVSDVSAILVRPNADGTSGLTPIVTQDATFEPGARVQVFVDYPAQVGDGWDLLIASGTITGVPAVEVLGPYDVDLDTSAPGTLRLVVAGFDDSGDTCATAPVAGYGFGLSSPTGTDDLVGYTNAGPGQSCTGAVIVADRWYRAMNTTNQIRTNTAAVSDAHGDPVPGLSLEMWDGCGTTLLACDVVGGAGNPPSITWAALPGETHLFRVVDELGAGLGYRLYGSTDGTFFATSAGASSGEFGEPFAYPSGALVAGAPTRVELMNAPRDAFVLALVSLGSAPIDVLGGTLYAVPFVEQVLLATNAAGYTDIDTTWPAGAAPNTEFWIQFVCQDFTVPDGLILSNAIRGRTPSEVAEMPN